MFLVSLVLWLIVVYNYYMGYYEVGCFWLRIFSFAATHSLPETLGVLYKNSKVYYYGSICAFARWLDFVDFTFVSSRSLVRSPRETKSCGQQPMLAQADNLKLIATP